MNYAPLYRILKFCQICNTINVDNTKKSMCNLNESVNRKNLLSLVPSYCFRVNHASLNALINKKYFDRVNSVICSSLF